MNTDRTPFVAPTADMLLDAVPAPAVVVDIAGRIRFANQRWVQFCIDNGGRPDAVSPPADYLAACDPHTAAGLRAVLAGEADYFETEYPCHGPTVERWFRMVATSLAGGALVVHLDITGEYVRVSRWLETTPSAIIELGPGGDAVFVNQAWSRYMRVPRRSLLGGNWADHLPGEDRERLIGAVEASVADHTDRTIDIALPMEDGSINWIRFLISAYTDDYGRLRRVSLVGMDVTAPRQLNEQLAAAAERERIAADIHDVVIQDLVATGIGLEMAQRQGKVTPDLLADVSHSLDRSIADLRALAVRLPSQRLGSADVDVVVRRAALALGFRPTVKIDVDLAVLDADTSAHLVAVINEALSNVAQHAHATRSSVLIARDGGDLVLTVRDDGIGMPDAPTRRSGTANIARRATELGGTATWSRGRDGGTVLDWRVPLNEPHPSD